jgi:hypothetical protein
MEPHETIKKIEICLKENQSSENIFDIIEKSLNLLRNYYSKNRMAFSDTQINYLKNIAEINKTLKRYIDLKSYINMISSTESYIELDNEFKQLQVYFKNYAIVHDIGESKRRLKSRIPDINMSHEKKEEKDLIYKILSLEKNAPNCPRGHQMTIRQGEYGYFWGCSSFPNCHHTKNLSMKEEDYLFS